MKNANPEHKDETRKRVELNVFVVPADQNGRVHFWAETDEELSYYEMALYEAGRLHVYYVCYEAGLMSLEDVANMMNIDTASVKDMYPAWKGREIVALRDTMAEILYQKAERIDMEKHKDESYADENGVDTM